MHGKKILLISSLFLSCIHATQSAPILEKYKDYLEEGTYAGQDWSKFESLPLSRYETFKCAFEHFEKNNGRVIVELGTSRSFTHGGHIGCNKNDTSYWYPNNPEHWDWGAGFFTRMAIECLQGCNPVFHTVDIMAEHINRCRVITAPFSKYIQYHVCSSLDFLKRKSIKAESIDLLYLDTGDMTPIEPTAQLQLAEARIIVERNLVSPNGIILIDDVRNQTPKKFGETSDLGKSKYSIPYLLDHGFKIIADGYQIILAKK